MCRARTTGVLSDVRVGDGELAIRVATGHRSAELVGESGVLPGVDEGAGRWRFALFASQWGLPARPAATGSYRLRLDGGPVTAAGVLDRLPEEHLTVSHRVLLRQGRGGNLVVRLSAPLADDELGPRAQHRLQAAYARVREPVDPGLVYFQSFTGPGGQRQPGRAPGRAAPPPPGGRARHAGVLGRRRLRSPAYPRVPSRC